MKACNGSIAAVLVVVSSLLAGCGTQFAATELNAAPPMGPSRPAASVEVFASEPPTRPHIDVRLIQASRTPLVDAGATIVDELRAEAGREGCDAIYLKGTAEATRYAPEHASATCVVYTDAAPMAAATIAPPAASATAIGAILH